MPRRNLKFRKRHALQSCGISLALLGTAEDSFGYRIYVSQTYWVWQRRDRRIAMRAVIY
jgi:hypothetical protein